MFIKWIVPNNLERLTYLGGVHKDDPMSCMSILHGDITTESSLWCASEEADDRMMVHVNHAVLKGFENIVIASQDTDVLVTALYNHKFHWSTTNLWILYGSNSNPDILSVNELTDVLDTSVVGILPAAHALTGCDSTSKVSTKNNLIKHVTDGKYNRYIENFGIEDLDKDMIAAAEFFLVRLFSDVEDVKTFNDLRYSVYHKNSANLDLGKLPCTSNAIEQHIKKLIFNVKDG